MNTHTWVPTKTIAMPTCSPVHSGVLQRTCNCGQHTIATGAGNECDECRKKRQDVLQRAAVNDWSTQEIPPIVHEVLSSPGQPLDVQTRAFMEPRFGQNFRRLPVPATLQIGDPHDEYEHEADQVARDIINRPTSYSAHDFSQVRVHTDSKSAESANAVKALAYTVGKEIVFNTGEYVTSTNTGRQLLAHELTHVIQQERAKGGDQAYIQRQGIGGILGSARRQAGRIRERVERWGEEAEESVEDIRERVIGGGDGRGDIRKITFNGSQVNVSGTRSFTASALSGLLPNHPDTGGIDFTDPLHQEVPNKGPIPEGNYYINPGEAESNPPGNFNVGAWGRHRTRLHEVSITGFRRRLATDRTGGFYLHEDANHNGTAGCIGLTRATDNARLHRMIRANSALIPVEVRYPGVGPPSVRARLGRIRSGVEEQADRIRRRADGLLLQRQAINDEKIKAIPPIVHGVLQSPGELLENPVRRLLETRFGHSFENVRIHTDSTAHISADAVNARAYTLGKHVVFGAKQYQPSTVAGLHLLTHELTHVIQQGKDGASLSPEALDVDSPSSAAEAEAREASSHILNGSAVSPSASAAPGTIQLDTSGSGTADEEDVHRLRWPGVGWPSSRLRLLSDEELQLDPELQAQFYAMRTVRQLLDPDHIRTSLLRIDFDTLLATLPPPWLERQAPPAREPLVPRGTGPSTPRPATGGDVARAIFGIPAVNTALTRLRTEAEDRARREWRQLGTGERVLVISHTALISGMALAGVLSNPEAREFIWNQMQDRPFPVPGVRGLTVEFNLIGPERKVMLNLNLGALLPPSLGFR